MSFEEAVAGARERLIRAVELRLRADVPLAFCMSGGVDSLALISIARNVFDYDVHGFTIVNSDARYEEQDMVEHAVERLGVRHTSIALDTEGFLPRLRELVRHHDAPVYTITYYVQWLLMQAIHEHGYRVSVSGTAADELYSGYYDHHLAYLREVHDNLRVAQRRGVLGPSTCSRLCATHTSATPTCSSAIRRSAVTSISALASSPRISRTASPRASASATSRRTCCATGCSTSSSRRQCR